MSCGTASIRDGSRGYKLIIVLDSNEYVLFLNKKSPLLKDIFENEKIVILISELIVSEVLRNVEETFKKDFYKLLFSDNIRVYREKLPYYLLEKYKN